MFCHVVLEKCCRSCQTAYTKNNDILLYVETTNKLESLSREEEEVIAFFKWPDYAKRFAKMDF